MHDAGLIVLTAFISPYRADRQAVRDLHPTGAFLEVHVDTPIEVCEARDVKGLYAKARAGDIPEFSGISAPLRTAGRPRAPSTPAGPTSRSAWPGSSTTARRPPGDRVVTDVQPLVAGAILAVLLVTLVREVASPPAAMVGRPHRVRARRHPAARDRVPRLASPATISIAGLFIVARALRDHADLEQLVTRFLGDGSGGPRQALARFVPRSCCCRGS
jgi:hypothetical protein